MKTLEDKYIHDKLTVDELILLRSKVNSMTDDEVGKSMQDHWERGDIAEINPSEQTRMNIDVTISSTTPPKKFALKRYFQIAAAVMIPLFFISTIYFYFESRTLKAENMVVSTGINEKANITLPDGTKVSINSESSLAYSPHVFNKAERLINFEGEAYFDVEKNLKSPFVIETSDLRVRVVGTKFNLTARTKDSTVRLSLEEGVVMMTSKLSNVEKRIVSNQKATLNKFTGEIIIDSISRSEEISPWIRGELVLRNVPLKEIIKIIETNYGVEVKIIGKISTGNDLFSGTISSNNMLECIKVIEKAYNVNASVVGKEITIKDFK